MLVLPAHPPCEHLTVSGFKLGWLCWIFRVGGFHLPHLVALRASPIRTDVERLRSLGQWTRVQTHLGPTLPFRSHHRNGCAGMLHHLEPGTAAPRQQPWQPAAQEAPGCAVLRTRPAQGQTDLAALSLRSRTSMTTPTASAAMDATNAARDRASSMRSQAMTTRQLPRQRHPVRGPG